MEKRTLYINRVNELNQEFHYAHPLTEVKINNIFNTHFYGSQLWYLFSVEAIRLEKTWNISQRIMLGIPRNTHRFFIEPLTEIQHIQFSLLKRFVNFVNSIESSKKSVMRNMLKIVKQDCRTTPGRNLCKPMLVLEKHNVDEISKVDLKNQILSHLAMNGRFVLRRNYCKLKIMNWKRNILIPLNWMKFFTISSFF